LSRRDTESTKLFINSTVRPLVNTLSVVIPTYNERENIRELFQRISDSLSGVEFEVIFVDDNSPDGTGEVADELALEHENVKVIHRPVKLGLGSAVLSGAERASGDVICVMDADLQHPPELLGEMWERCSGADVVIASRYVGGGGVRGWSPRRKLISSVATALSHLLLEETRRVRDPLSGYFAVRRAILERARVSAKGFKILLEILVKGKPERVVEVPCVLEPRRRGKSKMGLSEIFGYVKLLFKLSGYRVFKFGVVGASGIAVNQGLLWTLVSLLGAPLALAGVISIESAIMSNFALNDLWTFKSRRRGKILLRALKYHASVASGGLLNYVVLLLLTIVFGIHYLLSNLIGIFLGFLLNYCLSEVVVWK